MTALRTLLEDAVVTQLSPLLLEGKGGDPAGYLYTVEPYNGDLSPAEDHAPLKRLMQSGTPAVGVATGDGDYGQMGMSHRLANLELELTVLLVASLSRSLPAHNRGDSIATDPGAYQAIEDIRDLLWAARLDVPGVGVLDPAREEVVLRTEALTVWQLSYVAQCEAALAAADADAEEYDTLRTNLHNLDDESEVIDPLITGDLDLT